MADNDGECIKTNNADPDDPERVWTPLRAALGSILNAYDRITLPDHCFADEMEANTAAPEKSVEGIDTNTFNATKAFNTMTSGSHDTPLKWYPPAEPPAVDIHEHHSADSVVTPPKDQTPAF